MLAALLLLAGAAKVDVSPQKFPVIINCGFLERTASKLQAPLYARAIVLESGRERVAIAVVDSCMMPRDLIDRAKAEASKKTGIPVNRMLIAATHTHSAPASMPCLGSRAQTDYAEWLPGRIAEAIDQAAKRMVPARAGWAVVEDAEHTHNRRWIYRADKMLRDPFGGLTVRANMHPGYQNPDTVGESGPVDPGLSVLSIQTREGKPLALLANYSQHYFGADAVSPDYYGLFAQYIGEKIGGGPEFVGFVSQGTSGDQMWMDYGMPKPSTTLDEYARGVADSAFRGYQQLRYSERLPLKMEEATLRLRRRVPDAARLAWARDLIASQKGPLPATQAEVYAHEAVMLHDEPERELKLQALRIGDLGIAAIPNEVFALTGLKIKARSPLATTFTMELANGAEGYIPPPEQHRLGGYTTWPARSAGLEVDAEPKIVDAVLGLLERVSGKKRRTRAKPALGHWPMNDMDLSSGAYEGGVAFYLPGPDARRAVQFAGGRMRVRTPKPLRDFTASVWVWNAGVAGTLFNGGGIVVRIQDNRLEWNGQSAPIPDRAWVQLRISRKGKSVQVQDFTGEASEVLSDVTVGEGFEGRLSDLVIQPR